MVAAIDNFFIHKHNELPYDILAAPYQFLHKHITRMAANARTQAAGEARTGLKELQEVDYEVLAKAYDKCPQEDKNILAPMLTLSGWSNHTKQKYDEEADDRCPHCHK